MSKASRTLIAQLQRNRRFMGTCPSCHEDFRLSDAVLFSLHDDPPPEAQEAIQWRKLDIKHRRAELTALRDRMTKRAEKTSGAVNLGKIVEKIVPSFSTFPYVPGDCRALFEPVDYLVFSGLIGGRGVDALVFVDVKSGGARLTNNQMMIKDIVESGAISFDVTGA